MRKSHVSFRFASASLALALAAASLAGCSDNKSTGTQVENVERGEASTRAMQDAMKNQKAEAKAPTSPARQAAPNMPVTTRQ